MISNNLNIDPVLLSQTSMEDRKLKKALQGFESIFVLQLLKSMRSSYLGGGDKSGFGKDTFMSIADQALADYIGENDGLGISKILEEYFAKVKEPTRPDQVEISHSRHIPIGESRLPEPMKLESEENSEKVLKDLVKLQNIRSSNPAGIIHKIAKEIQMQPPEVKGVEEPRPTVAPESKATEDVADKISDLDKKISDAIDEAAKTHDLPKGLIEAIIKAESNGNPRAVSSKGAKGLMQLIDTTANDMGVADQFDPKQNVMGGAKYVRKMLDRFKGDLKLALAAYNAGPGNVEKYGGIPPFDETRNYVEKVIKIMNEGEIGKDSKLLVDKPNKEEGWSFSIKR
jgi:Rod binding domain-containing protein